MGRTEATIEGFSGAPRKLQARLAAFLERRGLLTSRSLAVGAVLALALFGAGSALNYLVQLLLARWAGPEAFGLYVFGYTWTQLLTIVAGLGLPTAVIRFVPEYLERRAWSELRGVLRRSRGLVVLAGVVVAALGSCAVLLWSSPSSERQAALLGLLLVPLAVLVALETEILRAGSRVVRAFAPPMVLRPLLLAGGAYVVLLFRGNLAGTAILLVMGGALLATFALQNAQTRQVLPRPARAASPEFRTREWLAVALPMLLISAFLSLVNHTDIVMLGIMRGGREVGVYAAAAKTATLVALVLSAANAVLAPRIASLHASREKRHLEELASSMTRWTFLIASLAALALLLLAEPILSLFGAEFQEGSLALRLLAAGHAVNAGAGPVGYLLILTGHERLCAWVYGTVALLNVGFNLLLIPLLGFTGAAIATVVSTALWNLWLSWLVSRRLEIGFLLRRRPAAAGLQGAS